MHTQSGQALQLQDVNNSTLDSLVLDYLAAEEFVEEEKDDPSAQEQLEQRAAAYAACQQLQQGNVSQALAITAHYCPTVLEDPRLLFRLKRQQFIELLRQKTPAADSAALACAREDLAPMALDAYPEAFLDFKKTLLMLVDTQRHYQQQQQQQQSDQQQQQQEWSLQARQQLAETLCHSMLLQMGCRAPSLSLLLRYLLHLYAQHTAASNLRSRRAGLGGSTLQQGQQQVQLLMESRGAKVAEGLLQEGRDEGPLPPDVSGQQPRASDVQALMAAVSIPRRAAEDALKLTGGDVAAALSHLLGRLRLHTAQLDCLVWEYATARGLLEPAEGAEGAAAPAAATTAAAAAVAAHPSLADAMEVDSDADGAQLLTPKAAAAAQQAAAAAGETPIAPGGTPTRVSAAAAGGAAAAANMPQPPLPRSAKRSKAAISSSSSSSMPTGGQPHNSSSPFQQQQQQQQQGVAAAGGEQRSSNAAVGQGSAGSQGLAGGQVLNRSASQSPPYKAPRYRRKQTPSRFYSSVAAEGLGCGGSAQQQQQQQQGLGVQLEEVVVVCEGNDSAAAAAAAAAQPHLLRRSSPKKGQQQGNTTPPKVHKRSGGASGSNDGSSGSNGSGGQVSPGDAAQQLVAQARAAAQQQRWQQLQQQLKSRSAAGEGGAVIAEQLETQQQLQQVQLLLQQGQFAEAEGLVGKLAPTLLQEHPRLLFELKQCQFTALVEKGELAAALQVARGQLTPLADAHPDLLPALKAAMALMLPSFASSSSGSSSSGGSSGGSSGSSSSSKVLAQRLWDALLPVLQGALGVEPPRLVSLMQVLLTAHKAWFAKQRCRDPFAATLAVNQLQLAGSTATQPAAAAAATGAEGGGERAVFVVPDSRATAAALREAAAAGAEAGAAMVARGMAARLAAGAAAAAGGAGAAAGAFDWEQYAGAGVLALEQARGALQAARGPLEGDDWDGEEEEEIPLVDEEGGEMGGDVDEAAVLQVMEVLELPRGTALELLADHGGDAQAVIMAVFGG